VRHILIILSFLLLSSPLFGQSECDDTTIARMIKSGISDKTIEGVCGKIGEEEKVSEKIEKTEDEKVEEDLKISDESERPYQAQIILLSTLGSGISLFYNFKNDIGFGVDSQNISASFSGTSYTHNVESNLNFSTTYLSARYYLLEIMPSFFIQGGYISRSWTIDTIGTDRSNTSRVSKVETKYPNNALNAGFGWNWMSNLGISGGIHFISIVGEGPTHTYSIASGSTFDKASYETLMDEMVPNSTFHLNLGYNFNF
jgi:hypothetical protein